MAKRIRIAIPYVYDKGWVGGVYYIINLIKSLKILEETKQPKVFIIFEEGTNLDIFKKVNYSHLYFKQEKIRKNLSFFERIANKLLRMGGQENYFHLLPTSKDIDVIFPSLGRHYFSSIPFSHKFFWIPDFQDYFYPDFFEKEELKSRKITHQRVIERKINLILSSHSAKNDFKHIYPKAQNEISVIQFAVFPSQEYKKIDIKTLLIKFNLPQKYFICSNQFWIHKNHITVLKALKLLKEQNISCKIVFTGNPEDYRNPDFYQSLLDYVKKEDLNDYVAFLGFIDRNEQLKLMSEAIAVVQPSLFEGWSTVVEDAKAMNQYIILSDIAVHKEQISKNVTFFEQKNEVKLSEAIISLLEKKPEVDFLDYQKNQFKFANTFINAINQSIEKRTKN